MSAKLTRGLILGALILFLVGPFELILGAALSAGQTLAFLPQGLLLRWVAKFFTVDSFRASFTLSILLAFAALILGISAAYAMARYRLPGAEVIRNVVSSPIIVPGIIVGLALLRYLVVPFHMNVVLALFLAHTALVLPYAVRLVSARLNNLRADVEEAAHLFDSGRLATFFRVVMPNIRGDILAAFILGFVDSLNQVPVSLFLTGPGVQTLPIDMLGYLERTHDPSVAAISALLAFLSIGIVFLAERLIGFSRYV